MDIHDYLAIAMIGTAAIGLAAICFCLIMRAYHGHKLRQMERRGTTKYEGNETFEVFDSWQQAYNEMLKKFENQNRR